VEKYFPAPEKSARFFHTMEKVFAVFPHHGKNVSTVWKNPGAGRIGLVLGAALGI
jgi:hypothetical protein